MSKITEIKVQEKNKERVSISLDGKFFCGLQMETVIKNRIKIGDEISEEKLENLQFESEKQVAFNKVLNLISKRLKTKHELKVYLQGKGYSKKVVDYVIEKLSEYNYVNDANYAKLYVKNNLSTKGARRLRQELILKGISKKIIDEALLDLPSQDEQIEVLVNKYMQNKEKTRENYAKLYAYLIRRGFNYDQIEPFIKFRGEN
ncbi:MAG: RecX family transcriptional regulator [Spirochaetales bacterium]